MPDSIITAPTRPSTGDAAGSERVDNSLQPHFLSDLDLVDSKGATVNTGKATINQDTYLDSVYMCSEIRGIANINCISTVGEAAWADYNVPANYTKFDSWIGFGGRSASDCDVLVEVLTQNRRIYSRQMRSGDVQHITADIADEFRVRLQIRPVDGGRCFAVFVNAQFVP